MKLFMLFLCLSYSLFLCAQNTENSSRITGRIIEEKGENLSFVAVSLYTQDSILHTGGLTKDDGTFEISTQQSGCYYLQIEYIGYQTYRSDSFCITGQNKRLGRIILKEGDNELTTVNVVDVESAFKNQLGKQVLDVEKAGLSDSEHGLEVIRAVPSVVVDEDGKITSKGKSLKVYINARPSGLTGDNQKAILEQIPAHTIKYVELLSNPSAKHDPDGSGGILNIVLKKKRLQGLTGNVGLGGGTEIYTGAMNGRLNAGINVRTQKVNAFVNASGYFSQYESEFSNWQQIYAADSVQIENEGASNSAYSNGFFRAGLDYFIDDKQSITLNNYANLSPQWGAGISSFTNLDKDAELQSQLLRSNNNRNLSNSSTHSLIYAYEFKDTTKGEDENFGQIGEKKELVLTLNYNRREGDSKRYFSDRYFDNQSEQIAIDTQETVTLSKAQKWYAKLDYTHPFAKEGSRLEVGAKASYSTDLSDFDFRNYDLTNATWSSDTLRSNVFEYRLQLYSAYASFAHQFSEKWEIEGGLRAEIAIMESDLKSTGEVFRNDYFSLFPNFTLGFTPKEGHQLSLSYSRRVDRPYKWNLNPFPTYTNPYSLDMGNPYLLPSFNNNIDLSYALYKGAHSFNFSVGYDYSTGEENNLTVERGGILISQPQNIGVSHNVNISAYAQLKLFKWWNLNIGGNTGYTESDFTWEDSNFVAKRWYSSLNTYMRFNFKNGWSGNCNLWMNPGSVDIQGRSGLYYWFSLGVRKKVLKNKGSVSLSLSNPIRNKNYSEVKNEQVHSISRNLWSSARVRINFSYRFGKMNVKDNRRSRASGGSANTGGPR